MKPITDHAFEAGRLGPEKCVQEDEDGVCGAAPERHATSPGDVKLRLRWFPGRNGVSLAEAGGLTLSVSLAPLQPTLHPISVSAWSCRSEGIAETFTGTRAGAESHLEERVRDRLIKALAAFGEEKT